MKIERFLEDTIIKLLHNKSITDIRVSELIDDIGICKGTFYKYYCDKYDLLEHAFDTYYFNDIKNKATDLDSFIHLLIGTAVKNRAVFINAYRSEDINSVRLYTCKLVQKYVEADVLGHGKDLCDETVAVTAEIYSHYIVDFLNRCLRKDLYKNPEYCEKLMKIFYPEILK